MEKLGLCNDQTITKQHALDGNSKKWMTSKKKKG